MIRCGRSFQSVPVHRRICCPVKRCLLGAVAEPPAAVAGAVEGVGVVKEVPERTAGLHAQTVRLVCAELPASSRDGEI
jgi:hypothetical protein